MSKVELKVKEVDSFFEELLSKCKQSECYSVIETAETMGVSYPEVKKWAKSNENWTYTLELCREICYFHAKEAGLIGDLSEQEAMKYMNENSSHEV